ncbi:MAG: hypothetical protein ACJ752_09675 [Gaiellaceae bacterium]
MLATMLFLFGVRISTWTTVLVFALLAAWRSERVPLLAAIAWLASFETAYQIAAMILRTPSPVPLVGPVSISLLVGAPAVALLMTAMGARANRFVLGLALLAFVVWIATGFHVNTETVIVSPTGEALNDTAKTLWALAYLLPLLRARRPQASALKPQQARN